MFDLTLCLRGGGGRKEGGRPPAREKRIRAQPTCAVAGEDSLCHHAVTKHQQDRRPEELGHNLPHEPTHPVYGSFGSFVCLGRPELWMVS